MTVAIITKSKWTPSKPWKADLKLDDTDNGLWINWCYGFKTMKSLVEHIQAVDRDIEIKRG